MTLEPLEQRRLLTAVPPVLVTNVNTIAPSQPVTLTANMPAAATGTVDFMDGTTDVGSEAVSSPDSQAIAFDGLSGYVSLPSGSSGLHFTSGDFTIAFWFDPANADENTVVLDRGWAYNDQKGDIEFKINYESGKLDFQANTGSEGAGWLFGWDAPESALSASFNVGQWNQVVVTRQGYTYSMWMNGVLAAVATSNADISDADDTNPFLLGTGTDESGDPDGFFTGSVSELDIWTTGLAAPQVAALRNGGYVFASDTLSDYPDSSELLAGYHLSGDASDFSGNGYDGTPSSGVEFTGNSAAGAMATITTTLPNVGNSITAAYSGDGYGPSTSAAQSVVEEATTLSGISSEITNQPPNQSTPSPLTDGSLTQSVAFTTGSLNYVSNAVGNATVGVDASFEHASDYAYFTATLTLSQAGDEVATNTVYYSATGAEDGTSYRFTVPIDGQGLPTGTYSYEMDITPYHSDDSVGTTQSVYGTTNVLNRTGSIFGQGWNLDGLDQLVFDPTGYNATYVRSDGTMGYFTSSDGVDFTSPAGPFAYMQLTTDGDGNYFLNDPSTGTTEEFSSGSTFLTVTDHDGNVTTYSTTTGAGFTVTDPAGQVTTYSDSGSGLIDSIEDFDSRETDLGYDTTDFAHPELTSVTLPNPYYGDETQPVYGFGYGPNSGMMISYTDADGNESQFAYNLGGALATEMAADGTTTAYQAADAPGVLYQGDNTDSEGFYLPGYDKTTALPLVATANAVAVETDQSGAPTIYTFSTFGGTTSVENALGNTTIYDRDTNGLVTEMIQPAVFDTLSGGDTETPTTYYTYTDGNLHTLESPDGSTQTWSYTSLTGTYGGQYDVVTTYEDGLGNETQYSYNTTPAVSGGPYTADLVETDQYAGGGTSEIGDTLQNTAADGDDPITTDVYTANPGVTGDPPAGLIASETNPDGDVDAFSYNQAGDETAEFKGQTITFVDSDTAAFNYLPQSPGLARNYTIYVNAESAPESDTGYTIGDTAGSLSSHFTFSASDASALLGSGWYELGTVKVPAGDASGTITVACPSGVTAVTLLEQTSATTYSDAEDPTATVDALDDVVATVYDSLDQPITASQGQALPADPTFNSAAFENVPQTPGMARTLEVYVVSSDHLDDYSFSDTAGSIDSAEEFTYVGTSSTSLGGDWFYLGYLTLPASDTSSTVTVSNSESSVSQYALLQQTDATVYDASGNDISDIDGMGRAQVNVFNDLQQQTTTLQGQVLPVASSSATFSNLPLTPEEYDGGTIGQARSYTIAVKTSSGDEPTDTSFHLSDGSATTSFVIAASSLGSGWYQLGAVTLPDTDAATSLTFSSLASGDAQICLLQPESSESYTPTGLPASETDADNQTSNLGYDVLGEATSVSAPPPDADSPSVRPVTSDVYDADGRTTAEIDPVGRTTAYVYSVDTVSVGWDFYTDTTTTYTGQTLPVVSDAATFANLPEAAGTADNQTYTILVYSTTAVTSSSGYAISDETDSLTLSSDVGGDTPLGANWYELGTVSLPAGKSTIILSTPSGVTEAAVLLQCSVDTTDADGNLLTAVDAAGNTATLTYNPLNEPAQQTNPENDAPLGPVFDKAGLVASDTDLVQGAITTYEHDFLGDVAETDQPNPTAGDDDPGPVTLDVYDIDGELVSESDPQTASASDVTSYATDAFGNTVSTSLPNASTGAAGGPTTTDVYDLDHEMVQEVDPMGNVSAWTFNYFGDEVSQSLPDPTTASVADVTTSYTVDADHDTLSETDPDSNVTSWAYNNDGQEAAETTTVPAGTPDSTTVSGDIAKATETFARDLDGNLTTLVDFDQRDTDYTYNLFNQEVQEVWYAPPPGGGANVETNTITYAYNVLDQMTAGDDAYYIPSGDTSSPYGVNTSLAFAYDLAGDETGESQGMAGRTTVILSSAFDYNGDRTSLGVTIGGTLNADGTVTGGTADLQNSYDYDQLQEMTDVAQTDVTGGSAVDPKYAAIGYDFGGEATSVDTYAAGSKADADSANHVTSETLGYNGDSQATDIGFTSASTGDMLAGYHYDYNSDQSVTDLYSYSDTDTSLSTPDPSDHTTWAHAAYSYDNQQQLGGTSYTYWANPPATDGSLSYDPNGNRDSTGETVSPGNQVTYDGEYYYQYDAEGNRTYKFKSTTGALDDTAWDITKYTWDNRNRMTGIAYYATYSHYTSNSPDMAVSYEYDALDRPVDEDQTAGGSLDQRTIWDGSNPLEVLDGGDSVTERFLNGPAVDQVFAQEFVGGSNPGTNWLLADGQGSVRDVVRATLTYGDVTSVDAVDHVFLDAFGDQYSPQSNSDAQEQTTVGFTGLRYDTLSGFYMSETREYDPATGTWIQRDPSGLGPDSNPYRYCGNSPTNYVDPSGLIRIKHQPTGEDIFQAMQFVDAHPEIYNRYIPRKYGPNGNLSQQYLAMVYRVANPSGGGDIVQGMSTVNNLINAWDDNEKRLGPVKPEPLIYWSWNISGSDFWDYLRHPTHMGGYWYIGSAICWGAAGTALGGLAGLSVGIFAGAAGAALGVDAGITTIIGTLGGCVAGTRVGSDVGGFGGGDLGSEIGGIGGGTLGAFLGGLGSRPPSSGPPPPPTEPPINTPSQPTLPSVPEPSPVFSNAA